MEVIKYFLRFQLNNQIDHPKRILANYSGKVCAMYCTFFLFPFLLVSKNCKFKLKRSVNFSENAERHKISLSMIVPVINLNKIQRRRTVQSPSQVLSSYVSLFT